MRDSWVLSYLAAIISTITKAHCDTHLFCGPVGAGKSSLCMQYLERFLRNYRGINFAILGDETEIQKLKEALKTIIFICMNLTRICKERFKQIGDGVVGLSNHGGGTGISSFMQQESSRWVQYAYFVAMEESRGNEYVNRESPAVQAMDDRTIATRVPRRNGDAVTPFSYLSPTLEAMKMGGTQLKS